ncbi:MAG: 5'/3'-nucleotidase SurE [Gammaproteobacteria bacterium]|jgi:5'-nucleotidase
MRILVSNDDGVYAPGLTVLADVASEMAEVTVVAPDRDRSGVSNSLTLNRPVRLTKMPNGYISVDGTPTDCVHVAITGYLENEPDMVIAGINSGANLGDDVLYSGTVAAATEGRFLGYPALAVSLAGEAHMHYQTAANVVRKIIQHLIKNPLSADTILNINVPDIPYEQIKGYQVTRLGERHRAKPAIKAEDPRGRTIYWVGPAGEEFNSGPGTDFYALSQHYVSITPLQIDLTRYSALDDLTQWVGDLRK